MSYIYRFLQNNLEKRSGSFRAVLITGPRRSGKSTFAQHLLELWGGGDYCSFDTPLEQARFKADPVGFISALRTPAVLDEVQNVPELFNYLKQAIDKNPTAGCDYILTGSQNFQMMQHVSESLAGRILIKELLPFALGERLSADSSRIAENFSKLLNLDTSLRLEGSPLDSIDQREAASILATGGYPQSIQAGDENERNEWFNSYIETYVQRDVRSLSNVHDLATYTRFVGIVAGRTAQLINYSELGKDIGVNYKTAQRYLSLLEASYLWKALPPYYKEDSEKRLIKSPKGIFCDSGLSMFLSGLHAQGFERNPMLGRVFESFVIMEIHKLLCAFGHRATLCHFGCAHSAEVDLVIEYGSTLIPIEIKCSASIDKSWGKGIELLRKVAKIPESQPAYVISLTQELRNIGRNIWNLPLKALC